MVDVPDGEVAGARLDGDDELLLVRAEDDISRSVSRAGGLRREVVNSLRRVGGI